MNRTSRIAAAGLLFGMTAIGTGLPTTARAQDAEESPSYLRDRGTGTPMSMFGTFIRKGELMIYPFFEYYTNGDEAYAPEDFAYVGEEEFEGEYTGYEYLIWIGYGLTDNLAFELEVAYMDAALRKDPADGSGMPDELSESGHGDTECQIRWRELTETERRPELFAYFEMVFPLQDESSLIGTSSWEFKLGQGITKGFNFGTMSARVAVEYDDAEEEAALGEAAIEYLRRINDTWRIVLAVEGADDEWELITEAQWHLADWAFVKLNSAVGITAPAEDWAPEIGILFSF